MVSRSPCRQSANANGPVPTGRVAFVSAEAGSTITASPQAILNGNAPSGALSVTRTCAGEIASTVSIPSNRPFCAFTDPSARARSSENTTSSAAKSAPSWNLTPCRRWKS